MPKLQRSGSQNTSKVLRHSTNSVKKGKRNAIKQKGKIAESKPNLTDLPQEVIDIIFDNVHIWHLNRIRATCRFLRYSVDMYIMRKFKTALYLHDRYMSSFESASLRSIKYATDFYVDSGFTATFCGCLLSMIRCTPTSDPFYPDVDKIREFLMLFYKLVEERIGDEYSAKSRLLYGLVLLFTLGHFEDVQILEITSTSTEWRTIIQVDGGFIESLWTEKTNRRTPAGFEKRMVLLVMCIEILLSSLCHTWFKRVLESKAAGYHYGYDNTNLRKMPMLIFKFTVIASKEIQDLFQECLLNPNNNFSWSERFAHEEFRIIVDFESKREWHKLRGSKLHHFELGPPKTDSRRKRTS